MEEMKGGQMIKWIYFFHRKPGLSVEDFQAYWRLTHSNLVRQIPGIRRYLQCHTLLSGYRRPVPPPLDGIEEIYFDSMADLSSIKTTAAGQAAEADLVNFVDTSRVKHIVTQEILMKEGATHEGMVKLIELVMHKAGMDLVDFHRYWEEVHGPIGAKIKQSKRYVQSHTLMSEYEKEEAPAYDGVAEVWFPDTGAMRQSATTPEYAATIADEGIFIPEAGKTPFIITRELKII